MKGPYWVMFYLSMTLSLGFLVSVTHRSVVWLVSWTPTLQHSPLGTGLTLVPHSVPAQETVRTSVIFQHCEGQRTTEHIPLISEKLDPNSACPDGQ